jgi:hypothetical protein
MGEDKRIMKHGGVHFTKKSALEELIPVAR